MAIFNSVYKSFTPQRLPAEYQEVEYIQSSWTQYINTGYQPKIDTEFEIKYELVSYPNRYNSIIWTRKLYNDWAYYIWWDKQTSQGFCWFSNTNVQPTSVVLWGTWAERNISYKNWVLSDGVNTNSISMTTSAYWNLCIFAENLNWTIWQFCATKLYKLQLYEWNVIVYDFVPCYRKLDGVIWLYDTVNDVFYTNSWTWTFTKWWDV